MAAVLKQAGYATGICGRWGLGGPESGNAPNDKGFDFFFGFNCQRHAHLEINRDLVAITETGDNHWPNELILIFGSRVASPDLRDFQHYLPAADSMMLRRLPHSVSKKLFFLCLTKRVSRVFDTPSRRTGYDVIPTASGDLSIGGGDLNRWLLAVCCSARNGWAAVGISCEQVRSTEESHHARACLYLRRVPSLLRTRPNGTHPTCSQALRSNLDRTSCGFCPRRFACFAAPSVTEPEISNQRRIR